MTLLIVVVALALLFDYINGFHDAANSISCVVSTKALTPIQAVCWAAFFNGVVLFLAQHSLLGFEFHVADTVAKIVKTEAITLTVILAGLLASIAWNLFTWWYGIPSSSSHTLLGGFAGAAIAKAGFAVLADMGKIYLTLGFIFMAPLLGMLLAMMISIVIANLFRRANPSQADRWFRRTQLVSSAAFSLGHGSNDAQKVMGIISAALLVYAHQQSAGAVLPDWAVVDTVIRGGKQHIAHIPLWVQYSCFAAIALGTLSGGWRIIRTMGTRITKLRPVEGVAADSAGAITLYLTQFFGIPVSTTHTITGSIVGVGAVKRVSAVRWGITRRLLLAWILTIPVTGLLAAIMFHALKSALG
ncbi:inorganic phosphate transporter [Sulfuricaulis limicola]|uniref:Inorganic phosphate transporter n=1 Tax=Sulfuricaulis limicola TaxID=1620215 RepID=A0A1B4XCV0_9GAMM|nr:inorganic phosphate transporter [Sulfuricaulis limicola]BAV32654.1 inorganic phosphate transporter [Sulfuricaulis limicola]